VRRRSRAVYIDPSLHVRLRRMRVAEAELAVGEAWLDAPCPKALPA
jgi:hypothetical protein